MRDPRTHVVIVGTGFAGLGMAIQLKKAGIDSFTIYERAGEVGGTWRDNHYPGCACDIPSHLYSFSFEPQPYWRRMYAQQPQIFEYLKDCADKYGLRKHIRFNTEVRSSRFDEEDGLWTLELGDGSVEKARVVVSGCGGLSRPMVPTLKGIEDFEGKTFHSARWDHEYALAGKTVAVVGTGASAIQFVPEIAPEVRKLHLFQRTPPWVLPKNDFEFSERAKRIFKHVPGAQKLTRLAIYARAEIFALGFVFDRRLLQWAEKIPRSHLAKQVQDPELRERLTPSYTLGCKRILISNDYYPALCRDNVELITDGIDRVDRTGVWTVDGKHRPVDAIIFGTGFNAADDPAPFPVVGRAGVNLQDIWRDGAEAHLGTSIAGFPNLFLIVGPNTGLGHNSMIYMIESQVRYIVDAIKTLRKRKLKFLDVKRRAQDSYNRRLHERLHKTVWSSGCASWYQSSSGKITTLWPGFTFEYRLRTRRIKLADYEALPE